MTIRTWNIIHLLFFSSVNTQSAVLYFNIKLNMTESHGHPCGNNYLNSGRCIVWLIPASCWQGVWLEVYCSFCTAASASLAWPVPVNLARDFSCTPGISICMSGWIYIAVYVSHWLCQYVWLESLFISSLGKKDIQGTSCHPFHSTHIVQVPMIASVPPSHNFSCTFWVLSHGDRNNHASFLANSIFPGTASLMFIICSLF